MPGRTGQKGPKAAPARGASAPVRRKNEKKARPSSGAGAPRTSLFQNRFKSLFQNIREAVAVYEAVDDGRDFIIRDFNPAAEAIEHVRHTDVIGRKVTAVFPGVEAFGLLDVLRRVWKSGKTESFPARVYKDDHDPGTWRENEVYKIPNGEIVAVYRDVTDQKRMEAALRESEDKFKYVFDHSIIGKSFTLPNGEIQVNAAFGEMLGYTPGELQRIHWRDITHPDDLESTDAIVDSILSGRRDSARFTKRYLHKDGRSIWADVSTIIRRDKNGRPLYFITAVSNITERIKAEEEIRRSLREKETLLREIYHRTKNNMNVIASMLSLRARTTAEPAAAEVCRDVQDRIRSMALVHQKLYESRDLSSIDLKDYIEALAANLVESYGERAAELRIVPDLEPVVVPIDIAIPCGMILNELFSNAFKHAFPEGRAGTIRLRLQRAEREEIEIVFSDDGDRAPEGFDPRAQAGLGLRTLCMLVEHQLQGSVAFEANAGLTCRIRFAARPPATETPA